jgi:hypothetical protein
MTNEELHSQFKELAKEVKTLYSIEQLNKLSTNLQSLTKANRDIITMDKDLSCFVSELSLAVRTLKYFYLKDPQYYERSL